MNLYLSNTWREVPVSQVIRELQRLNFGRLPHTLADCEAIADRLHWRLRILPRALCPEPFASERKHVIYLPDTDEPADLVRVALHELSEIITGKEGGEPEYWHPGGEEVHHQVALLVEAHWTDDATRTDLYCITGELPPPPGDADAPAPDLDSFAAPAEVAVSSWFEAAQALSVLDAQAIQLQRLLEQVHQAQARVRQEWYLT